MTRIFFSSAQENADCAEQMCQGFEARGYSVWRDPAYPDPTAASYPQMIEQAIVGSGALVLLWNGSAAHTEWVERQLLFAQGLKKPIFAVLLDSTALPTTLVSIPTVGRPPSCVDAVPALLALPAFPLASSPDPLLALSEKAAHDWIRMRKEAIDEAAEMLRRGEQRDAILALLTYLAKHDSIMGVREKAQEVLNAQIKQDAPPSPFLRPADSRHIFGVRCKNGHVSYFDLRIVCTAHTDVPRSLQSRAGKELDELYLKCQTCGEDIVARVDCGAYK